MADRSNAQQTVNQYTQGNNVTTVQGGGQPMIVTQAASGSSIPSSGASASTPTAVSKAQWRHQLRRTGG